MVHLLHIIYFCHGFMSQDHFQYRKIHDDPWLSSVVVILCGLETVKSSDDCSLLSCVNFFHWKQDIWAGQIWHTNKEQWGQFFGLMSPRTLSGAWCSWLGRSDAHLYHAYVWKFLSNKLKSARCFTWSHSEGSSCVMWPTQCFNTVVLDLLGPLEKLLGGSIWIQSMVGA